MRFKLAIMRRAAGLCLLLVMSACGEEPLSLPTAPTVPQAVAPQLPSRRTDHRFRVGSLPNRTSATGRRPMWGFGLNTPRSGVGPAGSVKSDSAGRFSFETPSDALVRLYTRPQRVVLTVPVDRESRSDRGDHSGGCGVSPSPSPRLARLRGRATTLRDDIRGVADGAAANCRCLGTGRRRVWATGDLWLIPAATRTADLWYAASKGKPERGMRSSSPSQDTQLAYARLPTQGAGPLDVELRACTADRPTLEGGWCH